MSNFGPWPSSHWQLSTIYSFPSDRNILGFFMGPWICEHASHYKNPKESLNGTLGFNSWTGKREYAPSWQASIKCEYQLIDADSHFTLAVVHHLLCDLKTKLSRTCERKMAVWKPQSYTAPPPPSPVQGIIDSDISLSTRSRDTES